MLLDSDLTGSIGDEKAPSGRLAAEVVLILLAIGKSLRISSLHGVSAFLEHHFPIGVFLFFALNIASIGFLVLHKPWTWKFKLNPTQWILLGLHALLVVCGLYAWLQGLQYFGPIRTIIASDYAEFAIVYLIETFTRGKRSGRQLRGAILLAVAFVILFASGSTIAEAPNGEVLVDPSGEETRNIAEKAGLKLSKTYMGGIWLLIAIGLAAFRRRVAKRIAPALRSSRKVTTMSVGISGVMLLPIALISYFTSSATKVASSSTQPLGFATVLFGLPVVALFMIALDYYIETTSRARLSPGVLTKVSLGTQFAVALIIDYLFGIPSGLDAASITAFVLVVIGQHMLHGNTTRSGLAFEDLESGSELLPGASSSRRDFDVFGGSSGASSSMLSSISLVLKSILSSPDSRKIFLFLMINFGFMFVELLYGFWTNSLGLIGDAFHMLFDCTALAIGLWAAVISKWDANRVYTYGFGRVEVLAGFINGVFLIFIAFSIFIKSIQRMIEPQEIHTDRLLLVSVLGLLVNLVGVVAFHDFPIAEIFGCGKKKTDKDGEEGAAGHGHDHGHGHGHSHGHHHHGHGHDHHGHDHHHSDNLYGIFLHIMADALGSVGVIISTILIQAFGWRIADPICSMILSILIFWSTISLLKGSVYTLLQRTPESFEKKLDKILDKIRKINGVVAIKELHCWPNTSSQFVATAHVLVKADSDDQFVVKKVSKLLKHKGCEFVTVQAEREAAQTQAPQ